MYTSKIVTFMVDEFYFNKVDVKKKSVLNCAPDLSPKCKQNKRN